MFWKSLYLNIRSLFLLLIAGSQSENTDWHLCLDKCYHIGTNKGTFSDHEKHCRSMPDAKPVDFQLNTEDAIIGLLATCLLNTVENNPYWINRWMNNTDCRTVRLNGDKASFDKAVSCTLLAYPFCERDKSYCATSSSDGVLTSGWFQVLEERIWYILSDATYTYCEAEDICRQMSGTVAEQSRDFNYMTRLGIELNIQQNFKLEFWVSGAGVCQDKDAEASVMLYIGPLAHSSMKKATNHVSRVLCQSQTLPTTSAKFTLKQTSTLRTSTTTTTTTKLAPTTTSTTTTIPTAPTTRTMTTKTTPKRTTTPTTTTTKQLTTTKKTTKLKQTTLKTSITTKLSTKLRYVATTIPITTTPTTSTMTAAKLTTMMLSTTKLPTTSMTAAASKLTTTTLLNTKLPTTTTTTAALKPDTMTSTESPTTTNTSLRITKQTTTAKATSPFIFTTSKTLKHLAADSTTITTRPTTLLVQASTSTKLRTAPQTVATIVTARKELNPLFPATEQPWIRAGNEEYFINYNHTSYQEASQFCKEVKNASLALFSGPVNYITILTNITSVSESYWVGGSRTMKADDCLIFNRVNSTLAMFQCHQQKPSVCSRPVEGNLEQILLQEDFQQMLREMTVQKNETKSQLRKLKSIEDKRPAARAVGSVGVFVICCVVTLIILSDLVSGHKQ